MSKQIYHLIAKNRGEEQYEIHEITPSPRDIIILEKFF